MDAEILREVFSVERTHWFRCEWCGKTFDRLGFLDALDHIETDHADEPDGTMTRLNRTIWWQADHPPIAEVQKEPAAIKGTAGTTNHEPH